HARQDVDASSVTPADGEPAETKKARYVVALSRVLRSTRSFAPAVRPRTTLRPQARANLGKPTRMLESFPIQEFFPAEAKNLRVPQRSGRSSSPRERRRRSARRVQAAFASPGRAIPSAAPVSSSVLRP